MARAPSYAFYETKEVLNFFRVNDYKEPLCKRVLQYLYSIQDYLRLNPDPKAFVLRKSLVLLKRKQKTIDQKEFEDRMFKDSPGAEEHLKTLFEHRRKKRNPSPKRGLTFWLSLGCLRSKSQTPLLSSAEQILAHNLDPKNQQSGELNKKGFSFSHMKLSGVHGVRVNKKPKNSPVKKVENNAGDVYAIDNAKNLNEVFGKDEKKVSTLYHAVKLVNNIHLRNEDDEKME